MFHVYMQTCGYVESARWFYKLKCKSELISNLMQSWDMYILVLNDSCCVLRSWCTVRALTHWGWVMHICVSKLTIIGSDNAIIWTNAGTLLIWPLGTNFSEILIQFWTFSFRKMHLKISSGECRPFCLGLTVLSSSWWWPYYCLQAALWVTS